MKKNKQKFVVILLVVLLVSISIGYAILSTNLNITGTTGIDNAKWDIHWQNVQITSGSVSGSNVTTPATIDGSGKTVTYSIKLDKPGDFYEFTVQAINAGTIDGMVSSVSSKLNGSPITTLPAYLQYYVKYADGIAVAENQLLGVGQTETYRVRVEFKKDITNEQLPTSTQTLNLSFTVDYAQATSDAMGVRDYLYRSNTNEVAANGAASGLGTTYTSYTAMNAGTGKTVFLRHKVRNSEVTESEVGFTYEGAQYYLVGGINEAAEESHPVFDSNGLVITSLGGTCNSTRCTVSKSGVITAFATLQGQVYAFNNDWRCDILSDGTSSCKDR